VNVARFASRNGRVILLGIVLVSAAGLYSMATLPSNIYPEVEFPRIQMVAHTGDLSPRMMQLAVTRPLEEAARTVLGVRRVRSKTIRGACEVSVIFNPDADMPYSLQLMQAKADEVRPELPAGTELVVERMTPSLFPILCVNLTGGPPPADLRDLAVYQLRPLLVRVPGVADVEVLASEEREISVIVDPDRLNAARGTIAQVGEALKATNQVVSVGRLPKDYRQYLVLTTAELTSIDDVRKVVVAFRQGTPLDRQVDEVELRPVVDRTTLITGNGQPAALLNVARQIRGNILEVADGVWAALKEYRPSLPPAVRLQVVYDLAEFVRNAVASVRDAILIGGFLAVLVLVVFLRDWRVTAIAATSLPLTMIGTFFILHLAGGTINLMSLGASRSPSASSSTTRSSWWRTSTGTGRRRAGGAPPRRASGAAGGGGGLDPHHCGRVRSTGASRGGGGAVLRRPVDDPGRRRPALPGLRAPLHPERRVPLPAGPPGAHGAAGLAHRALPQPAPGLAPPSAPGRGRDARLRRSRRPPLLPAGDGLPARDGRGRVRDRLLDARGHVAPGDGPHGPPHRGGGGGDTGGGRVRPTHGG
jgi:hypothetical protein